MPPSLLPLERIWPPHDWQDATVLVGVSGGPDSVALFCRLAELRPAGARGRLVALYFDHGWRPEAATEEARFVANLAAQLGCPFDQGAAPEEDAGRQGRGREGHARALRWAFFDAMARKWGARHLALGHTQDDQIETVLQRVLRGTGLAALRGIPRFRRWHDVRTVVRPLLPFPRRRILAYLRARSQPYLDDPTNADCSIQRNRIRRELLPLLRTAYHPGVDRALLRLARRAREWYDLIRPLVDDVLTMLPVEETPDRIAIPIGALLGHPRLIRTEVLRHLWREARWPERGMNDRHWRVLAAMIDGAPRRHDLPGGVSARCDDEILELVRRGRSPRAGEGNAAD